MKDGHSPDLLALGALSALRLDLKDVLEGAPSLAVAAQRFAERARRELGEQLPLVRIYAALPSESLPARERAFAIAAARGGGVLLTPQTPVLSLLGTAGDKPEWNERLRSERHLAIPLLNADFVDAIPMVARLLGEIGVDLRGLDREPKTGNAPLARPLIGGFNGVFYVPDARTERDSKGRLVIPDQQFVAAHSIRTVFGMGGSYLGEAWVTAILFTREALARSTAERFAVLISSFKMSTHQLVSERRFF
jgi:hypothetical protein